MSFTRGIRLRRSSAQWRERAGMSPSGAGHGGRAVRSALLAVAALLLMTAQALPAAANPQETDEGRLLVVQAVSLIANRAAPETVQDRIQDSLMAPDLTGVDLDKVEAALALVEESPGDPEALGEARGLLESAVSIRAATGYGEIPEPGEVGTGEQFAAGIATGTTVILDPLDPELGIGDAGDVILIVLAAGSIVLGLYLSRRWRPDHTVSELRREVQS